MSTAQPATSTYVELDIARVTPSPTNPRKHFDQASLQELAASIRQYGVQSPLLVRPSSCDDYEIIAGERRWRASKIAGLEQIPAIVRAMDDLQVLEVQLLENVQREDLHPMEEADGYERLVRKHGYSAEQLADKVGRSTTYIYARMRLCALGKEARAAFLAGKFPLSIALLLARVPTHELQREAVKALTTVPSWRDLATNPYTVHEARALLQREFMMRMDNAPFDVSEPSLPGGACTLCLKRTCNQTELFADLSQHDMCTDPGCFREKIKAHGQAVKQRALAQGRTVIEGKAAKKLLKYSQQSNPDGYVGLATICYQDAKSRPYAKLVDDKTPIVYIENPHNGAMLECIAAADARALLKRRGIASHGNATTSRQSKAQEATRAREELTLQIREAVLQACHERLVQRGQIDEQDVRLIAATYLDRADLSALKRATKLWGCESGDALKMSVFGEDPVTPWPLEDLPQLLIEVTLAEDVVDYGKAEFLLAAAKRYGVDVGAIERRITAEAEQRRKLAESKQHQSRQKKGAAKKAAKTAAKKPTAKKAPAKKTAAEKTWNLPAKKPS